MESTFKMIDVGEKNSTHRRAIATGQITLSEKVCRAIVERKVPKGDVLALAEVAGINGAKRTADLLPLCHPLTLEGVRVHCELSLTKRIVTVRCEVSTHGKTGVEMEALSGTSAALLCIYDLTKALDKGAEIGAIHLEHKSGGKSGDWNRGAVDTTSAAQITKEPNTSSPLRGVRAGVVTISDSCAAGHAEDLSGKALADYLKTRECELINCIIVPDDIEKIRSAITTLANTNGANIILTTGGTGLGPRDLTPEALAPLWTKQLPGFGEELRSRGRTYTTRAWLSRAVAGAVGDTLVFAMPGSPSGVRDGLTVLEEVLPHALQIVKGSRH